MPGYLSTDAELVVGDVRDRARRRPLPRRRRRARPPRRSGRCRAVDVRDRALHVGERARRGGRARGGDRRARPADEGRRRLVDVDLRRGPLPLPAPTAASSRRRRRPEAQLARRDWELRCPDCGEPLEPLPTPESKPLQPTSIYAIGKRDHEEMFLAWGRAYGVPATALRFFNVYGPRQALSNPYTGVRGDLRLAPPEREAAGDLRGRRPEPRLHPRLRHRRRRSRPRSTRPAPTARARQSRHRAQRLRARRRERARRGPRRRPGAGDPRRLPRRRHPSLLRLDRAARGSCSGSSRRSPSRPAWRSSTGWLAGQTAVDRVDEATAALRERGLAR